MKKLKWNTEFNAEPDRNLFLRFSLGNFDYYSIGHFYACGTLVINSEGLHREDLTGWVYLEDLLEVIE